jgi:hypothetical protein
MKSIDSDVDKIYQRIGEFTVSFQWIEHLIRQIGWLIDDPGRKSWPSMILRDESNSQLLLEVEKLYCNLIDKMDLKDSETYKKVFNKLIQNCHELRIYRNNLLHSAYIEIKAGDEVKALMRSNTKIKTDKKTGKYIFDHEILTEKQFNSWMGKTAQIGMKLSLIHAQIIQWDPFKKEE